MNFLYNKHIALGLVTIAIATSACGQHAKVKTITIVNGDTTITESNLDEKEMAKMEKEISVIMTDDGKSEKKIVKKIIINDDGNGDAKAGDAMAYAYSFGEGKDQDIEVITDGKDGETKVIIRNKDKGEKGEKGDKGEKEEKRVVIRKSMDMDNDNMESVNLNINVKGTNAKIEYETNSKEPLSVSVLDENGKQVFYDSQKTGGKYIKDIPLGKKGTYFLNLIQNKKSTSEKIVIE